MKKTGFFDLDRCFGREAKWPGEWRERLGVPGKLVLELGCGKAEWSIAMAAQYPDTMFIGIDIKADRLWVAAQHAAERGVTNVAFACLNLFELDQFFAPGETDELWITFPDPFPKKRQAKHRMVYPTFLPKYRQVLHSEGFLHLKTDNLPLFQYTLETFVEQPWMRLRALSFDLHGENELPAETKVLTAYERKFLDQGLKIYYAKASL